jgi:nucleoside-diphosphate kinase
MSGNLYNERQTTDMPALQSKKENAVADFRELIGATDPAQAAPTTIRAQYAESKAKNAVHGSDSDENAALECAFHFSNTEIVG